MSLAAAIQKHATKSKTLEDIIADLPMEDGSDMILALRDADIPHTAVVKGLKEHSGIVVSEASVRRWRAKYGVESVELEEAA